LQDASQSLGGPIALAMRIDVPEIDRGIRYAVKDLQRIVIYDQAQRDSGPELFYENTTTLLELRINRFNTYVTISQKPRKH
jgi:hypothetical protein